MKSKGTSLQYASGPKVQSTVTPEPKTFNDWLEHLLRQRLAIWRNKLGRNNDDLIDIERDND